MNPLVHDSASIADAGTVFISTLREIAATPDTPLTIKADWKIIEEWLHCRNRVFSAVDNQRIRNAWRAYLAIGLAPSVPLQPVFDKLSSDLKRQDPKYKDVKVPTPLMDVFDRLLATDAEIKAKRIFDIAEQESRLVPTSAALKLRGVRKSWWRRQTFQFRRWAFFSMLWITFTFVAYSLLGPFHRGSWDYWRAEEVLQMFFVMALPLIGALLKKVYEKYVK